MDLLIFDILKHQQSSKFKKYNPSSAQKKSILTFKFCGLIYKGEIVSKAVIKPIIPNRPCDFED